MTAKIVKASDGAHVGYKGTIDGLTYTIIDETTLRQMINNDEDVTKVITTLAANMSSLFKNRSEFNQDISGWDVGNVVSMDSMFFGCQKFNQNLGC